MLARTILTVAICSASLLATACNPVFATSQDDGPEETKMILTRNGSQPSIKGPDDWFTGSVRIDPICLEAREPSRLTSAIVTFEPGARTNWHTHPLGQLLIVTSGKGWTQCEGEPRVEINAGDTIWCPPGHKHWHGATSATAMSHIAVQEMLDGKNVDLLEPVTDAQYGN